MEFLTWPVTRSNGWMRLMGRTKVIEHQTQTSSREIVLSGVELSFKPVRLKRREDLIVTTLQGFFLLGRASQSVYGASSLQTIPESRRCYRQAASNYQKGLSNAISTA